MRMLFSIMLVIVGILAGISGWANWKAEKNAPMLGSLIEVNGVPVHVLDLGQDNVAKRPVVLIHGASANLRDMKIALGDELAKDRRVIMIDRSGRGYSGRPDNGWRLETQAAQINGVVKALGLEDPIIVGQSFGGAVALSYALQFQEDITGLVLLAPVSHEWPGGIAWYNSASETPIIGFLLRRLVIPVYGQLVARQGIDETFQPNIAPENYSERSGLALLFRPKDFRANASDIFHLKDEIKRQQGKYQNLSIPVEIVTGASDTAVSPEIHSKALEQQIAGASLSILPDTGHALHHARQTEIIASIDKVSGQSKLAMTAAQPQ